MNILINLKKESVLINRFNLQRIRSRRFILVLVFITLCFTSFGQKDEFRVDTTRFRQLGLSGYKLHYVYTDTIKTTTKNYEWPFLELNILAGLDINNWLSRTPDHSKTLNLLKFDDKFDGIKRLTEMGSYEIELKLNTPRFEFNSSYFSQLLSYEPSLQHADTSFFKGGKINERQLPGRKKEIRIGVNYILNRKQTEANQIFIKKIPGDVDLQFYLDNEGNILKSRGKDAKVIDFINQYYAVEKIITQKYTALNVGYIGLSYPIVYNQEPQYTYYPTLGTQILSSYRFFWDKYSMNGLSIGIMQRKFKRYTVEVNSPIQTKYGLGARDNRCISSEYGLNIFLGAPSDTENKVSYNMTNTGGEIYYKAAWDPFMIKINGGKMIGRPNDWYIRLALGFTFRRGKTVINSVQRSYVTKDYL